MAGITSLAYRELCFDFGAELAYTEMVSAKAITLENKRTFELLKTNEEQGAARRETAAQLFGHEPDVIAEAIKIIEDYPFVSIDINMGCPVEKIVRNGEGAALLCDLDLAEAIVRKAALATRKPVTVKTRLGFRGNEIVLSEAVRRFAAAGAAAVTVHARTREQFYSGEVNYELALKAKDEAKIRIGISGDIFTAEKARRLVDGSGFDYAMIARGSLGRPWIFAELKDPAYEKPIGIERGTFLKHFDALVKEKGDARACVEIRKFVPRYFREMRGASKLRREINEARTAAEIRKSAADFLP
jgi:nifR3 family TIM-barrel protein